MQMDNKDELNTPEEEKERTIEEDDEVAQVAESLNNVNNMLNDTSEEEMSEQEFSELFAEMEAINGALDKLEQRNDAVVGELRKILHENKLARGQLQQQQGQQKEQKS